MTSQSLQALLRKLAKGTVSLKQAYLVLRDLPFENLGFARLDHHRPLRNGVGEVIFCEGKTVPQVATIFTRFAARGRGVLATRATREMYQAVKAQSPRATFHPLGRTIQLASANGRGVVEKRGRRGHVLVVSAGTADLPIVAEIQETLTFLRVPVKVIQDVGVAGLHRLLSVRSALRKAKAIIVVAGMEGALASVIAGLVSPPVIAVPTSVGYGANFKGLSALLAMMTSCVPGVAVVNIDSGFSAAVLAYKIMS